MSSNKKLIETALPLDAISKASRRDKDRKTGTIKNVHKWFAPMPTPAWRALLFATLVDDPEDSNERARLLELVERLVPEDGGPPSPTVLEEARQVLARSEVLPLILDPFCGGGSTVVEAQRLGLSAVASDLNPVAVLITRTICQLLPSLAQRKVKPLTAKKTLDSLGSWIDGFCEDVHHYSKRILQEVWNEVGPLYPQSERGRVTAWLWARTVVCPNPGCRATIPLYSSTWLSKRRNDERWILPVVSDGCVRFDVGEGKGPPPPSTKTGRGAKFRCLVCGEISPEAHVKSEGLEKRLGVQLLATSVEATSGRVFIDGTASMATVPECGRPADAPTEELGLDPRDVWCRLYGFVDQADLFTNRQLHTLGSFASHIADVGRLVKADGGDDEYAAAIATVLGLCLGKLVQTNSTQARWYIDSRNGSPTVQAAFSRHVLPMVWDFVEVDPFGERSVGSWPSAVNSLLGGLKALPSDVRPARVEQRDARAAGSLVERGSALVATDPPYFRQIAYADLSDYFYVWHRRALRDVHPDLFGTIGTPKSAELIAAPYRHDGDADKARNYFVEGFVETFGSLQSAACSDFPVLVVYAHRQEEADKAGVASSAWDAMLDAMLTSGMSVVGTWPIHATSSSRQIGQGANALASYIVLVCRPRQVDASLATRRDFVATLRSELPAALRALQEGNIAPVDLAQSAIGPGMRVFSRFARVVEADGTAMSVRTALGLINQALDEVLGEQESDFDPDTRWALAWFEDVGMDPGPFGKAETLSKAKNTSISGLVRAGVLESKPGVVRLLTRDELPPTWDPSGDVRLTVWEVTQHLIRALEEGGEQSAAQLLRRVGGLGESARDVAYRLYAVCERKKWAKDALAYNSLVVAWPEVSRVARNAPSSSQEAML